MCYYFICGRYKEALLSLVSQVLEKIQFSCNQAHLDEMDDDHLDDDVSYRHSLRHIYCKNTI